MSEKMTAACLFLAPSFESGSRESKKTMGNLYNWVLSHLIGRIHGPLNFRLVLQPTIAIVFAIRDGLEDARLLSKC